MTTSFEALFDATAAHPRGLGALHLRARNKRRAVFYLQDGLLYAVRIEGEEPPLLRRLHWSLDENIDMDEVQSLAVNTDPEELRYMVEQRQAVSQAVLKAASRDFFLAMCEDVLSWGDVKQDWKNNESLPDRKGYRVPYLEVTQLRQMLERRRNDLEKFAGYIGVPLEEVFNVVVGPGSQQAAPETDAENVVLTLRENGLSIGQIVGEGGYIGSATIAKAIFTSWNNHVVELYLNEARLLRAGETPQPAPEVVAETTEDVQTVQEHTTDPEPQEHNVTFERPQRPQPLSVSTPAVEEEDEGYSIPLYGDSEGDVNEPEVEEAEEAAALEELDGIDIDSENDDDNDTPAAVFPSLPHEDANENGLATEQVQPSVDNSPFIPATPDVTGDLDDLLSQLSSVLNRVKEAITNEENKHETLVARQEQIREQIDTLQTQIGELTAENEKLDHEIQASATRRDSLKQKLSELS